MAHSTLHLYGVPASTFDHMLYREAITAKLEYLEHVITFVQLYPSAIRDTVRLSDCLKARKHNRELLEEKD
jgi:hypothetical protein